MVDEEEYLISYANLRAGLFTYQNNFLDKNTLNKFYENPFMGVPICLPCGIKFFDYSKANYFIIKKLEFSKKIFRTSKLDYICNKKYFRYGNTVVSYRLCIFLSNSPSSSHCAVSESLFSTPAMAKVPSEVPAKNERSSHDVQSIRLSYSSGRDAR